MVKKVRELQPPRGLGRLLARFPIVIYRAGLGWLFGNRMLLLHHVGRKSGLQRQVMLEVVHHDEDTDTYIVAVGFGERSQWYQNLLKTPEVSIQVGRRTLDVSAEMLSPEEGGQVFLDFCKRYPMEARLLVPVLGYEVDGSDEGYRAVGEMIQFVALRPR